MSPNRHPSYSVLQPPVFPFCFRGCPTGARKFFLVALLSVAAGGVFAQTTNSIPAPLPLPLPDAGGSVLRVMGSLLLVLGLFLGGVWLFKNWQRLALKGNRQPKLNVLESRSLGARQGVCVLGYDKQRFLIATSPTGVTLLSHLPDADGGEATTTTVEAPNGPMPFAQALANVLKRK